MKAVVFPALVLALALIGGTSLWAEDWTTIDGKSYREIKVVKVEPDAVTILHHDGGALVPLLMLPDNLQKKFQYDPARAHAAAEARAQADLENARALRAEARQIEEKKQALAEMPAPPAETIPAETVAVSTDPTHHPVNSLVDPKHRLMDDISYDNHYPIGSAVPRGPLSASADANHYGISSLFGSGDPLSR